jgi:hypothetical protein
VLGGEHAVGVGVGSRHAELGGHRGAAGRIEIAHRDKLEPPPVGQDGAGVLSSSRTASHEDDSVSREGHVV